MSFLDTWDIWASKVAALVTSPVLPKSITKRTMDHYSEARIHLYLS